MEDGKSSQFMATHTGKLSCSPSIFHHVLVLLLSSNCD